MGRADRHCFMTRHVEQSGDPNMKIPIHDLDLRNRVIADAQLRDRLR
jgi:hypothetical protein